MTEFKHIVVYGDSLSWGIIPLTRRRLDFASRWPQVMAQDLNDTAEATGRDYRVHVTEECLNGRRTAFEDPYKPGRSGLIGIQQVIEAQSPLDVVIIMLGTNDFQSIHRHTPWHSAIGRPRWSRRFRCRRSWWWHHRRWIIRGARSDRSLPGAIPHRRGWRMRCGKSRRNMGAGFSTQIR